MARFITNVTIRRDSGGKSYVFPYDLLPLLRKWMHDFFVEDSKAVPAYNVTRKLKYIIL